jgi:hypothetical protein
VTEVARHEAITRDLFTAKLEEILSRIVALLPPAPPEQQKHTAIGIFAVMAGALQMARAVSDKHLSDEILESGVSAALRLSCL